MTRDNQARYEDILRRISRRQPFGKSKPDETPPKPQDLALDLVNARDSLAQLSSREYPRILCYGPKSFRRAAWSAALIWYRNKGYHGYQELDLLGIWAHYAAGELELTAGMRKLLYQAPIFDAGVYRVAIENGFQLYYEDDGAPPGAGDRILYHAPFKADQRLKHRGAIGDILREWRREMSES